MTSGADHKLWKWASRPFGPLGPKSQRQLRSRNGPGRDRHGLGRAGNRVCPTIDESTAALHVWSTWLPQKLLINVVYLICGVCQESKQF